MAESSTENFLNALAGSLFIIFIMICSVYCLYKYAVCQEKKNNSNPVISIIPRTYSNLEVKNNNTPVIIVS